MSRRHTPRPGPASGVLWLCLAAATAVAAPPPAPSTLRLSNDGYLPGQLQGSPDPSVVHWRSPYFAQPLRFPADAVRGVYYAVPSTAPEPAGTYCFELAGDDVVFGELTSLGRDEVEIDAGCFGKLHLRRDQIGRIYPRKGAEAVYFGPRGLTGWQDSAATPQWRDEGGQIATERPDASVFADVAIPPKAVVEFELSWKKKADFMFAVGVDEKMAALENCFRFEVWDNDLVAIGESDKDADAANVGTVSPGEGRVRLQAYLDQDRRQMEVFSHNGKSLAVLAVGGKKRPARTGVRLSNRRGDVRLEHLRVTRWNGVAPGSSQADQSRLRRSDGTVVNGQITAYDPKGKKFTVRNGEAETVVGQEALADVFLSPSTGAPAAPAEPAGDKSARAVRLSYHDGSRFTGKLTGIEDTHVTMTCSGIKEPLHLPLDGAQAFVVLDGGTAPTAEAQPAEAKPGEGRPGRLEMDGALLKGHLIPGAERPGASCLVWQPDLALNASPLVPGSSGRIVYKEPPPPKPIVQQPNRAVVAGGGGAVQVIQGAMNNGDRWRPPTKASRRALHLRSGDTIPCEVSKIDDKGVTFATPISDATFVPHEKIKSVELVPTRDYPRLAKTKRERLLTLPRVQRDSPPTHLVCSKNGDFLRGRILEMDDKVLKIEVRLETREIPRDRVAQIIWLHADEIAAARSAAPAAVTPVAPATPATPPATAVTRVQTLRAPDNRLTFVAQKLEGTTLSGVSDVLGPCRAEVGETDELLFGAFIEQSAARLAYHIWKLHHAAEPKYVQAEAAGGQAAPAGTDSPLVGQPAYAFKLDLLDGKKFNLADRKGRIVVLDFWATWCGPCMQTMPLVDEVAREFADKGVDLVAVNLEEQPDAIKSMLERHKLKLTVALDRDGVVSAKYAVTAIPQTVVVDRDGKVARLFVGGGQGTADALKKTLQELSGDKPATPAAPAAPKQ